MSAVKSVHCPAPSAYQCPQQSRMEEHMAPWRTAQIALPTQGIWEEVSHGVIQSADTELTMAISNPIWSKVNNSHCWFHVDLLQNAAAAMFGESLSSVPGNLVSVSRLWTICSVLQYCHSYKYSKIKILRLSKEKATIKLSGWERECCT